MLDVDVRIKVIELRAKGKSIAKIADELSVAKQTVVDICKDSKEEVASLYAIQLERLYETEKVTTTERIKTLSALAAKLKKEIDERSLSDVPTEKLVDLYLKTLSSLDEAKVEPTFKSSKELQYAKEEKEAIARLL